MIGVVDISAVLPAIIVALAAFAVLLSGAFANAGLAACRLIATVGLLGALAEMVMRQSAGNLGGTVVGGPYSIFLEASILVVAIVAVWLASARIEDDRVNPHEFLTLMLFSVVGMLGLVTAAEAISLFVALEIMSVALYALCAMPRTAPQRQEAAIKYFLTGAFSSAFLLFGIALLYGASGSTTLVTMAGAVGNGGPLALMGAAFFLVGFLFKVGAAPFHMWSPDVYQGATTSVTAFMAAAVKIAAFGALGRVVALVLGGVSHSWAPAVALVAAFTMVIGNLGALAQSDLKRLLAYSSVAHAGYMLSGIEGMNNRGEGLDALLFYIVTYAITNLGAFAILIAIRRNGSEPATITDLKGLARRNPSLAAMLTLLLISLTGIPVSAGFVGKFQLFKAAVLSGYSGIAIVGVLMSAVSAFYYLRLVVLMYMEEPDEGSVFQTEAGAAPWIVTVAAAITFGLGIYPAPLLALAKAAAASLF
ncbi:MAG: NADH-quinone oxidoreductase subunit N [Vicinamibacteria bacterium]